MDSLFAESVLRAPHTVLGRELRPFSLWHSFVLQGLDSPYVDAAELPDDDDARWRELDKATLVCSSGFDPSLRCLDPLPPRFPHEPPGVFDRQMKEWRLARYGLDFDDEEAEFVFGYLRDFRQKPEFLKSEKKKNNGALPSNLDDFGFILGQLVGAGRGEREVWEMPEGYAAHLASFVRATWLGGVSFKTDMIREVEKHQRSVRAKGGRDG